MKLHGAIKRVLFMPFFCEKFAFFQISASNLWTLVVLLFTYIQSKEYFLNILKRFFCSGIIFIFAFQFISPLAT